jgi:hypothetical protein
MNYLPAWIKNIRALGLFIISGTHWKLGPNELFARLDKKYSGARYLKVSVISLYLGKVLVKSIKA